MTQTLAHGNVPEVRRQPLAVMVGVRGVLVNDDGLDFNAVPCKLLESEPGDPPRGVATERRLDSRRLNHFFFFSLKLFF